MLSLALAVLRLELLVEVHLVIATYNHLVSELEPVEKVAELVDLFQRTVDREIASVYEDVSLLLEQIEAVCLSVGVRNTHHL